MRKALSQRRQQVEIIAMAGAENAEIAAVEGGDVVDSAHITPNQRHKFYFAIPQVFQKRKQRHITEVAY